jgi:hypothetical protein
MENLVRYTLKFRHGYDDLKCEYAYRGNSQGDESASNDVEANKNNQWMSFYFDCPETQEAIDKEVIWRKKWNKNYINSLKANGKFGTEYSIGVSFVKHPLFDEPPQQLLMSSKFLILDLNEENKGE